MEISKGLKWRGGAGGREELCQAGPDGGGRNGVGVWKGSGNQRPRGGVRRDFLLLGAGSKDEAGRNEMGLTVGGGGKHWLVPILGPWTGFCLERALARALARGEDTPPRALFASGSGRAQRGGR